ncbi:hypothetical protein MJO29_012105 [Puccinia striiformis f. sp. tritici]|uniref:Uncharacterized protein n=1 Tax=Puccinia striiformis TaxID=27350 RepID=A0A2S4V586_9BASI|nr:hypothetical protein MJO29_012105 [Puccinia striiformis f. sp. tritici]POW04648.1 hypothetical protein PSTT_10244 [Puccinia striiformis]
MTAIGPSSQWDENSQPKIILNPYSKLLDHVNRVTFPEYTGPVRKVLIAFGCIHAFTVLVCVSVMLIPLRRSPDARKKFTWLLRKKYIHSISTPYHVMNSGLIVVASQLISSLVFVTYIILDYYSLNSTSFTLRACLHVCWELCLLPGYFGFHVTAFGSLYTCLCSPRYSTKRRRLISHPFFLNLLFYGLPVIVTIQTVAWSVVLVLGVVAEGEAYSALASHLEYGASYWQPGQGLTNPVRRRAVFLLANYVEKGKNFSSCWVWSSRTWSAIGILLAMFYALNVANLLYVLRRCLKVSQNPHQLCGNMRRVDTIEQHVPSYVRDNLESPTPRVTLSEVPVDNSKNYPRSVLVQPSMKELKNGYIYLIVHCSIMLLDLLIHVACSTIRTMHYEQAIVDKRWRSRTTWLILLGSTFASLAMIFHSWRIFTERDKTNIPDTNRGILVRKFLTSHREGPDPDASRSNLAPKQECHETDPNKTETPRHNVISNSSTPTSDWSISPVRPTRSPSLFSPLDDTTRYPSSYEMPPISERDNLDGCLSVEPAHVA